jgi:hypothetical protein
MREEICNGKNLNHHYSEDYSAKKKDRPVIQLRKPFQLEFGAAQVMKIREQGSIEEAGKQLVGQEIVHFKKCAKIRPRIRVIPLQPTPNRQISESERVVRSKEERKREFSRMREEHSDKMLLVVNMPQMTQAERQKLKIRISDVFKTAINPIMRDFEPGKANWEDWQPFEGPYEEL